MTTRTSLNPPNVNAAAMGWLISLSVILFAIVPTNDAAAVSGVVKNACKSDYFAHCSAHAVGSKGLRKCMRSVGKRLSPACVRALVASGEVTKSELSRYAKRAR